MKTILLAAAAALLLAASAPADLELILPKKFPVVGEEQLVRLAGEIPAGAVKLKVVYRPNSETIEERVVGTFDAEGKLVWRPAAPGITLLVAKRPDREKAGGEVEVGETLATLKVATCFAATPAAGILVMVLAGILLFGGAATSLVLALRKTPEKND